MDPRAEELLNDSPEQPTRSKLEPYRELIRELRRKRNNALQRLAKETGWSARRLCSRVSMTSTPGYRTRFSTEWRVLSGRPLRRAK
jgi:hypothetical protein